MARDAYEVLGAARIASERELRRAFRRRAKELHPDRNPGNAEAEAAFKELVQAWEILSDPERRRRYDAGGHRWAAAPAALDPQFAAAFSQAYEQAVRVFFDRALPALFERYHRGPGAELVHQMVQALVDDTLLDHAVGARPGFAARDQATRVFRRSPIQLEPGVLLGNDDQPVLGRLVAVRGRGLSWARVLVYPAAFQETGLGEPDAIAIAMLRLLFREYARLLERDLHPRDRALERLEAGLPPRDAAAARRSDRWAIAIQLGRALIMLAMVMTLFWFLISGRTWWSWWWP